ncbi:lysophosphatidic acid receptor 5b [Takifugu flavidus]|uniref:Lysophosphatidic acid receptor 6 n=1 Tax=Takifugu flavidus TaxID=433684 RepID=A0A5C6PAG9_9TELE|nr:lysophosphatidic acid receptor 5b [Takifugu flavidus]TWW76732.1 Lysophosphatidic acid receptor 6 [Takifugu flavidus]
METCNSTIRGNGTEAKHAAYALVFGSVIVLGLPLNAVSLWILLRRHSINSPSAVYMVNLAVSDLLLVVSLPMRVYFYATGTWPLGNQACIWITMLFHNNIRSSSIFITFICVDRLLAVVYPLRSRHLRSSSKAWKASGLVWLCVVMVNVPESVVFSIFLKNCSESACFEFQSPPPMTLLDFVQPVLVLTMLAVNVVCTSMVSWTLQRQLNPSVVVNNKVNVMLIFVMNLLMFALFFLPGSLVALFHSWKPFSTPLLCLASVNCCLDPVLYYFSLDGFWRKKDDELSLNRITGTNSWRSTAAI